MEEDYRRHDISGRAWKLLEPHLLGRRGAWGRVAKRKFINAPAWILRFLRFLCAGVPCVGIPSRSSRRQSSYGAHKRGLNTKVHLAVDSLGMPVRVIVTDGIVADCSIAGELIEGIEADYLWADREYDTDNVIEQTASTKMEAVISSKKNRENQRKYNRNIYENRYQVENRFLKMKAGAE